MKYLTLIILLTLHSTLFTLYSFSQPCLTDGIIFTTQAEIDSFQVNYPGCTEIEGDVEINGSDITNLNGLNVLTTIGGYLFIYDNDVLANLTGLNNLNTIGGNLEIYKDTSMTSLEGLESLNLIEGDLRIGALLDIIYFYGGNPLLNDLAGLNNLDTIFGNLIIENNDELDNLTGLENLKFIQGDLRIGTSLFGNCGGNSSLSDLTGLNNLDYIGGNIFILCNESLISLSGLENITSIQGSIEFGTFWGSGNPSLQSMLGLNNLDSIGGSLGIHNSTSLTSLEGLDSLKFIGEDIRTESVFSKQYWQFKQP